MFFTNLRAIFVTRLVAAGASQAAATTFVTSIGNGTILAWLTALLNNPTEIASLEQLIQFVVSLFAGMGGSLSPPTT